MEGQERGKGRGRGRNGMDMKDVREAKARKVMMRPAAAAVTLPKVSEEDRLEITVGSFS